MPGPQPWQAASWGWLAEFSLVCAFFLDVPPVSSTCPVASMERPFCSCFWGDRDSGGRACAREGGAGVGRRNCGLHGVHSCLLLGLFLSPLTPAFFLLYPQCPSSVGRFYIQFPSSAESFAFQIYVLSRAERSFPVGNALTF